jgi:hypothetical protein
MMRANPGEPTEMLKRECLSERLDSFSYSLEKMDQGRRDQILSKIDEATRELRAMAARTIYRTSNTLELTKRSLMTILA